MIKSELLESILNVSLVRVLFDVDIAIAISLEDYRRMIFFNERCLQDGYVGIYSRLVFALFR